MHNTKCMGISLCHAQSFPESAEAKQGGPNSSPVHYHQTELLQMEAIMESSHSAMEFTHFCQFIEYHSNPTLPDTIPTEAWLDLIHAEVCLEQREQAHPDHEMRRHARTFGQEL